MKAFLLLFAITNSFTCFSQTLKGLQKKAPAQETIFQVRKESDAAFVIKIQEIVEDTCGAFSSEKTYLISAKIVKKYFDNTGKFKDVKIKYFTTDTTPYTKDPYHIVFVNKASQDLLENCEGIAWISKPGTAFVFSTKTETMVGKKN